MMICFYLIDQNNFFMFVLLGPVSMKLQTSGKIKFCYF